MPLSPGSRLGPYEVAVKIGEGGMGEVWQARDTRLDRDVALKVLPEAFTADPDRLTRFEREAKVLASLNHPNIAAIHGLEDSGELRALVLELVEGPTLAERIAQGAMPIEDALPIAKQIAEALEAAHDAGVIHRDLKPANIKVREDGTVKVLDFGLAKALLPDSSGDPSESPTLTAAATRTGVLMGTAAYMSPEQAKGKTVDTRTDVWAFGCVLYEMLTGRRAFGGETVSDTLVSVLIADVDLDALPRTVPPAGRRLLRRCFERDPKKRLRDFTERLLLLEEEFAGRLEGTAAGLATIPSGGPAQRALPWASGIAIGGLVAGAAVWMLPRPTEPDQLERFVITVPDGDLQVPGDAPDVVISPDGTRIVFEYWDEGGRQLYIRHIDQTEATPLPGTETAQGPFFSPDGEWVGFDTYDRALKKVPIRGGPAVTILEGLPPRNTFGAATRGASWGRDGTIVFSTVFSGGLVRIPDDGGSPEQLTRIPPEQVDPAYRHPHILPDGDSILFVEGSGSAPNRIGMLTTGTGDVTYLLEGAGYSYPRYAPSGHLVFRVGGALHAARFDLDRRTVTGQVVSVVDDLARAGTDQTGSFGFSDTGTLVHLRLQCSIRSGRRTARRSPIHPARASQTVRCWPPPTAAAAPRRCSIGGGSRVPAGVVSRRCHPRDLRRRSRHQSRHRDAAARRQRPAEDVSGHAVRGPGSGFLAERALAGLRV